MDNSATQMLAPLETLTKLTQGGPEAYHKLLLTLDGDIPRIAAWKFLLERGDVDEGLFPALLLDCRFAAVRSRAFDYFETIFEHDLARLAAEAKVDDPEEARISYMKGTLSHDASAMLAAELRRFGATGDHTHLAAASNHAESSGWRNALPLVVQCVVAFPQYPMFLGRLLRLIDSGGDVSLMQELSSYLNRTRLFSDVGTLAAAMAKQMGGDAQGCLEELQRLTARSKPSAALSQLRVNLLALRADALNDLGRYAEAYSAMVEVNGLDRNQAQNIDPKRYRARVEAEAQFPIPRLPPDERHDTVFMVGFPRSGTTLLENALAAHPVVETFEEITSQQAAARYIRRSLSGRYVSDQRNEEIYREARLRYYKEIDLRRKRPEARVLIDKLPLRSADAKFLVKLFPDARFIFSIRHPYDVVLSCFRQRFRPNIAMENFRTILSTATTYDWVMRTWFETHSLDEMSVHYVRYDDLVTDFEPEIGKTLRFLDLDWDDAVRSFASLAANRAVRTPSYKKVRKGLTLGVQSSWRNYQFAFTAEVESLLRPWVEFFGYPTT